MPGTLSTITSVFPAEERARAVGIWAGFAGAGARSACSASGLAARLVLVAARSSSWPPRSPSSRFAIVLAVVPTTRSGEHVGLDPVGTVLSAARHRRSRARDHRGPGAGLDVEPLTLAGLVDRRRCWPSRFVLLGAADASTRCSTRGCSATAASRTGSASLLVLFMALFGFFLVVLQFLQLILGYSAARRRRSACSRMTLLMIPISALAAPLSVRVRACAGQRRSGSLIGAAGMVCVRHARRRQRLPRSSSCGS